MLYAELGRKPIYIQIKSRMIWYWTSPVNENLNKFSQKIYDIMLAEFNRGQNLKCLCLNFIKEVLISYLIGVLYKTQRQQKTKSSIG